MKTYAPYRPTDSIDSILSEISFLGGVTEQQREAILPLFEVGTFKKGEIICRHGEEPSHIYVIKSGVVDLLITDNDIEVKKREFTVGNCFGEAAMLAMNNNTATFVAGQDTELIMLSRRAFNRLRGDDPGLFAVLMINLARELARKLQYSDALILHHEHREHLI